MVEESVKQFGNEKTLFIHLSQRINDYPRSAHIPRKLMEKLLNGSVNQDGKKRLNNRTDLCIYLMMYYLEYFEGRTPYFDISELAEIVGCSNQTVINTLDRLTQQKLITYKHYEDSKHSISVTITNVMHYFKKFKGGYITIMFVDFLNIFEIMNPLKSSKQKKPDLNDIRAKLMVICMSKHGTSQRVYFKMFRKFFPSYMQRRGMLSRLFTKHNSEADVSLTLENRNLPNYISIIKNTPDNEEENNYLESQMMILENSFFSYRQEHGHLSLLSDIGSTVKDIQYRFLYNLVDKDKDSNITLFRTKQMLELVKLSLKIGYNKFSFFLNNINEFIAFESLNNTNCLCDLHGNKIKDLYYYILEKSYVHLA